MSSTTTAARDAVGKALGFRQDQGTGTWWGRCPRCNADGACVGSIGLACECGALPLDEAVDLFASTEIKPWAKPPTLPGSAEPALLPVDALPPVLRDMATTVQAVTQAPMDAAVAAVLGAVSVSVVGQALVEIDPRRGWRKPIHTYVGIEMPSGTGKSPLITMVGRPIVRWEAQRAQAERDTRRWADESVRLCTERLALARKAAARAEAGSALDDLEAASDALAKAEAAPRGDFQLLVQDATEEELVRILAANHGRAVCIDPEATILEVAAGRYGNGDARLAALTHGWDGESMRVNRVSRARVDIPAANLALLLGIQPGILRAMVNAETMKQRGVLARFLWVSPSFDWDALRTGPDVPALDTAAVDRYGKAIATLLDIPGQQARVLRMSPEAQQGVTRLEELRKAGMRPGGSFASIQPWAGKLPDHGARIAALLTIVHRADQGEDPFADPIPGWAMGAAIRIVEAVASHVVKVIGDAGGDPVEREARYVLERAQTLPEGKRTLRDLLRACDGRKTIKTMDDLNLVVDALVELGCIQVLNSPSTGGRPPSPSFELHPDIRDRSSNGGPRRATSVPSVSVSPVPEPTPDLSDLFEEMDADAA